MSETIKDGKGRGYLAGVNADNQLLTRATTIEQRLLSAIDENYYETTTGEITLSDAVETPIIYIKNNDTNSNKVIVIDRVFWDIFDSTGGAGSGKLKYYLNPTVTGGTDIVPNNTNFGTNKTLTGTFTKSQTTMTGTVWWIAQLSSPSSITVNEGRIIIPPGYNFGISIQAPTSNTSMIISVNIAMYLLDKTLIQ